jgi:hypothetical protein
VAEVVAEGYFTLLKSASGETLGVQEQGHLECGSERGFIAKSSCFTMAYHLSET